MSPPVPRRSPSLRARFAGVVAALVALFCLLLTPYARAQADAGAGEPAEGGVEAGVEDAATPDAPPPQAGASLDPDAATAVAPTSPPVPELPPTEAELARGLPIAEIEVAGNRRIAREDVLSYLRQKVGEPFEPDNLSRDVRELWDSGFFDNIEIDLERRDDGVHLRVLVRERPAVRSIEFTGNEEIDAEDLLEVLEIKTGTILSYPATRRSVQRIRDRYAEEGYFLAEVSFEVVPQRDNEVLIRFRVKENEQVTVRRITFIGNHHIPDSELRAVMITGEAGFFSFGSGGPFRQDAFERDILIINSLYYDKGFLAVQVATPRIMLTPDRTGIEVTVSIQEGPRFRIRQLRVYEVNEDGKEVEPLGGRRRLREMIRAKPGDYFNRAELVKDLSRVQTMYRDAGYAHVEAPPRTDLDAERREVDIVVPLRRGVLTRFGRIEVRGNTKTRDKVIRRELEVAEGELFSETGLETSKRRVLALGFFERVDVSTEASGDPRLMNVNIEVTEKPTGTFQVGAGFSSIENFIATAQVQQANLFGNGQSLSLQAQISGLRQLVNVRYFEPYFLESDFSAAVDLYSQLRLYESFSQESMGGSLTFGYPLDEPDLRASLTYTLERNEISTTTTATLLGTASAVSVFQRLPLANLFNDGITSSLRPALTYDTRDNRLFPTAGIFLQGSVEVADDYLGSDNSFVRYRATGRYYYPLLEGVVLKLNQEGGVVVSPDEQGVPIFARFFLGGILDVRGFRLRTIGPRLPLRRGLDENAAIITNGANIGGNLMYYQNLEVEFPILDKVGIRGVVFTDLGNAWNLESLYCDAAAAKRFDVNDPCFALGDLFDVRTSWGFGFRWFSPLGPLRFEWGFPFQPLPYEEDSVFEFTIGNFF